MWGAVTSNRSASPPHSVAANANIISRTLWLLPSSWPQVRWWGGGVMRSVGATALPRPGGVAPAPTPPGSSLGEVLVQPGEELAITSNDVLSMEEHQEPKVDFDTIPNEKKQHQVNVAEEAEAEAATAAAGP